MESWITIQSDEPLPAAMASNVCKNQTEDALRDSNLCAQQEPNISMTKDTLLLIAKAKKRDADAFTELMDFYSRDMYKVALAILMNDEDVADAMQDTILICWEKMHTLKVNQYFKTWLTRILINKCYDILDSGKNRADLEEWDAPSACDQYNLELKEAMNCLDEKYRLPILLFYWQGYSHGEIARLLQLPVETVRTRLKRGRKKLSEYYDISEMQKGREHE